MSRRPSGGDGMGQWNPMNEHFRSANIYQRNKPRGENEGGEVENEKKLFIRNIPCGVNADGLKNLFSESGKVNEISVVLDRNKPDQQFGFVTTETKADALRIIDHFDGFQISNNKRLKVQIQRPRKKLDEEKGKAVGHKGGSAGSSDSDSAVCNSAFESGNRPVGRSQRLLAVALGQEPSVGMSRSGHANGFDSHIGHGNTSDEAESSKKSDRRLQDVTKSSTENVLKPSSVSPQVLSDLSHSASQRISNKSSSGSAEPKTDSCVKCGRIGDKKCIICKQVYCSRECQREDWPYHKKVCVEKDIEVDEEFEKRFSVNFSSEFLQKQTEVIQQTLQLEKTILPLHTPLKVVCIVPPFSPSEIYVFLESDQQKLVDLGAKLNEHYNAVKNQQQLKTLPKVGDFCVSQFSSDNLWYRAEVEAVTGQTIFVRYVDYGNKEEVSMRSICEITDEFKSTPNLTVRCRLADLEPSGPAANGDAWCEKATRFLQENLPVCTVLTATAICFKDNAYHIELCLPDGSDIGKKLVDAGFARRVQTVVLRSPSEQTSHSPNVKRQTENEGKLTAYGWPSNLDLLKGQRMTVEFVEFLPPGEFWIRFDPLPGYKAPPPMRLSLADTRQLTSPQNRSDVLEKTVVEKTEVKKPRYRVQDLPKLKLENEVKVEVTVPQDPASFWCHDLLQTAPLVQRQRSCVTPDPVSMSAYFPEENEICLGFYEKYGEWYRVEVLEKSNDSASVFLIDYGEKITIPLTLLLPLPQELLEFPPLAFNCQLSAWNSLQVLSPDVPKHFEELVTGKPLICEILSGDPGSSVRSVILSDLQSGISIASTLFKAFERKVF